MNKYDFDGRMAIVTGGAQGIGDSMLLQFFSYKKDEWDRYHQAVTNWEVEEFLRRY